MRNSILLLIILFTSLTTAKASEFLVVRDLEIEDFLYNIINPIIKQHELLQETTHHQSTKNHFNEPRSPSYKPTWQIISQHGFGAIPTYKFPKENKAVSTFQPFAVYSQKKIKKNNDIEIFLIDNPAVNAFVANGRKIYVFSGLITAYDNINLLRGVLAHELGHIFGSHLIRSKIQIKDAYTSGIATTALLSLSALASGGVALPVVLLGSVAAGFGVTSSTANSYSRTFEQEADAYALRALEALGYTAYGLYDMMNYFTKLYDPSKVSPIANYFSTHPLPHDRLENIKRFVDYEDKTRLIDDMSLENQFQRVKAKIAGYKKHKISSLFVTKRSNMPLELNKYSAFYEKYFNLFESFASSKYQNTISLGNSLLENGKNDIFIAEVVAQSYCALSQINQAEDYFAIIRRKYRNNDVLEYEYGDCLIRFGKTKEYIDKGVSIIYNVAQKNKSDLNTRLYLLNIAQQIQDLGLAFLMQTEIYLIKNKQKAAKEVLNKAISHKHFYSLTHTKEILELNNILSN